MIVAEKSKNVHPRLLYNKQDIENFKANMATSNLLTAEVKKIREKCDNLLNVQLISEEYANAARTQHGNFYEIGAQLTEFSECFGLMFSLGEYKYVTKMKEALLHYASFEAWTGPENKNRRTPWNSDLSTTRILWAYAVAYDTMYDVLNETERLVIRAAMLKLAIYPLLSDWLSDGVRIHALDSMGHNWWSVCTALAGCGILAIYEDMEDSEQILGNIMNSLRMFCEYNGEPLLNKPANFDEKGMFYESANYFNYGVGELCRFIYSWRNCFTDTGDSDIPVLYKVADAYMAMAYPVSCGDGFHFIDFGDSSLIKKESLMLPKYLLLLGLGGNELKKLYIRTSKGGDILELIFGNKLLCDYNSPLNLPVSDIYSGSGLAFLRSSWEDDANMLAVRCGFTWNHSHDDAGSYILFNSGIPVIRDSGTVSYGRSDYVSYYCSAEAHNVVTVNGRGQFAENNYRGCKFSGRIDHFLEAGNMAYLLCDATGPMADKCLRNYRSFIRLTDSLYATVDDIYTYTDADYAWLLHYSGKATVTDGDMPVISIENAPAYAKVSIISPASLEVEAREHDENLYYALCSKTKSRLFNLISVIELGNSADAEVTTINGDDWYGAQISCRGGKYRLYYNIQADGRCMHINSNNKLDGWETDAYILCDINDGERIMMIYGSYLRREGRSYFESFQKEFKILDL